MQSTCTNCHVLGWHAWDVKGHRKRSPEMFSVHESSEKPATRAYDTA